MSPLFVLSILASILFCGLSLDIGMLELQRTQMQTAADAAAIAGEMQFERGVSANGSDAGLAAAAQHGFTNGVNNTAVTYISNPGLSNSVFTAATVGDYAGHYDAVQVQITRRVQTLFMGLLNGNSVTVSTTATASPPPCQYFLGTKNLQTPTVLLSDLYGKPYAYAGCSTYIGGGLTVPADGWWQGWQTYLTGSSSGSSLLGVIKRGTTFNTAIRTDPLASIVSQPTVGSCAHTNFTSGSLAATTTITLNPGVYCGSVTAGVVTPGITLINLNVTFNPGMYIVTGGIDFERTTTSAAGVTFFFTKVSGTSKYGIVLFNTLGNYTLNAASGTTFGTVNSNGAISGILFFCDRNWASSTAQDFQISSSGMTTTGLWYMPYTGLSVTNGASDCNWNATVSPSTPVPSNFCGVIADNLFDSNFDLFTLGDNFTVFPGGNPIRQNSVLVQ